MGFDDDIYWMVDEMTLTEKLEEIRKKETAVYLACEASVAEDLSKTIRGLREALELAVEQRNDHIGRGWFSQREMISAHYDEGILRRLSGEGGT